MIRRFLTRVLIVILIAACVYNWMQTRLLQAQVAALQMQAPPKQILATRQAPRAHSRLYSLQGQWERLQNRADVRSTRRKVLSYVKLYF